MKPVAGWTTAKNGCQTNVPRNEVRGRGLAIDCEDLRRNPGEGGGAFRMATSQNKTDASMALTANLALRFETPMMLEREIDRSVTYTLHGGLCIN